MSHLSATLLSLLCLCSQHHQLLPRGGWMWSQPLALTPSLLPLTFTRDHKPAGPVQVMLCRTWVAMEPPRAPGVGLWGLCASTGGFWSHCWGQHSLPAALWMPHGAGLLWLVIGFARLKMTLLELGSGRLHP